MRGQEDPPMGGKIGQVGRIRGGQTSVPSSTRERFSPKVSASAAAPVRPMRHARRFSLERRRGRSGHIWVSKGQTIMHCRLRQSWKVQYLNSQE